MRLYVSVAEFQQTPLYFATANQLSQLPPGALDGMLARASQRCDSFTHRRLGAPPTTTVGTGGISAGGTSLPLSSTLMFDGRDEQAVLIGSGSSQELLPILSGGVTATTPTVSPYPGTVTLAQPCAFSHSAGEAVVGYYQELDVLGHASNEDPFQEAFTQEAQLAQMHAPSLSHGMDLTRMVFLKSYPLISIHDVSYTYSYDTIYYSLPTSAIVTMNPHGYYRVRLGTVLFPGGFVKTTYQGGFTTVPDDIKRATSLYLRDELSDFVNPFGAIGQTLGKQSRTYVANGLSPNVQEAEALLEPYLRKV